MKGNKHIGKIPARGIQRGVTSLGQKYEICYENGLKVLNSENANYSFGSLHQIMLKGIDEVLKTRRPAEILMLGLGAGSALSVLKKKCAWPYRVRVVELDPELIALARTHFGLDAYDNLELITGDAAFWASSLPPASFDLIIDDVFWDDRIPGFCTGADYLSDMHRLLRPRGIYMRNTMESETFSARAYEQQLAVHFPGFYSLRHTLYGNKIYFCPV